MRDGRIISFRVSIAQSECNQPVLITKEGSRRNRGGTIWEGIHRIMGTFMDLWTLGIEARFCRFLQKVNREKVQKWVKQKHPDLQGKLKSHWHWSM